MAYGDINGHCPECGRSCYQEQQITELQRENAELKRWNANLRTENFKLSQEASTILEHCKDLERIIAESKKMKPVAYRQYSSKWMKSYQYTENKPEGKFAQPLYTTPPIQDGIQYGDDKVRDGSCSDI